MPGPKIFNVDFQTEIGNALVGAGGFRPAVVTRTESLPSLEWKCLFSVRPVTVAADRATTSANYAGIDIRNYEGDEPLMVTMRPTNAQPLQHDFVNRVPLVTLDDNTPITWNNMRTEVAPIQHVPDEDPVLRTAPDDAVMTATFAPTEDFTEGVLILYAGYFGINGEMIFAASDSAFTSQFGWQSLAGNRYYLCIETPNPDFNHGKLEKATTQTDQCHATVKLKAVRNKDGIVTGHENQVSLLASTLTMNGQPFVPQVGDKVTFQDETPNPEYTLTELVKAGAGKVSYRFTAT